MASAADVTELKARVSSAIASVGPGGVICADHRFASPLTPDVADAWSAAMRRRSRAPMRVGLLLDPSNTMYNLQIERVVQCVGNPGQRLFHDLHDLREWVGEALTEQERAALLDVFSDV